MGPIWDYDVSSGNVNYVPIVNATVPWMVTQGFWYGQWFLDPGFKADVVTQWNTLKNNGIFDRVAGIDRAEAGSLEQSQKKTSGGGQCKVSRSGQTLRRRVATTAKWPISKLADFAHRVSGFSSQQQGADLHRTEPTCRRTPSEHPFGLLRNGFPVTLTAQVSGGATPTGVVSFLSNGVLIGTGSLNVSGAASLTISSLASGNSLQAVYNGDNNNALSASAIQQVDVAESIPAPQPR